MKKITTLLACAFFMSFFATVDAQVKKEVKKDAQKVEHKTEEVAAKGAAKIKDKVYADKVGPDGQTIYIDKHDKYYWIDKEGRKKYIKKAEMKDK